MNLNMGAIEPDIQANVAVEAGSPLSSKIIRNAMFGAFRYLIVAPVPFIMTPLILHRIGVAGYGTWAIFLAINGLTSLADLGLVGTLAKFVAEYYAHRDYQSLTRLMNSGLALFLLLSATISSGLWIAAHSLVGLMFRGSTVPPRELVSLFRMFLIVITCNILSLLFSSVTSGLQRLDLTNIMSSANFILSAALGGVLLVAGWGLRGLVYGYIVSGILTVAVYFVLMRQLLPQVKLNPLRFDRVEAHKMFGFSLRLYVTQAAVAVQNQIEKVFLGMLVGVAAVGWYDIASDVALKIRAAIGFVLSPVLPAASELHALGDERRKRELYYRTHKYLALIGVPSVGYAMLISGRFIQLWVGPTLKVVAVPLAVLVLVNFLNLMTGPGFCLFAGSGNLRPGVQSATLGIILNLVSSFGLIFLLGFAGAVVGTACSMTLASAYFVWLFHRQTKYPYGRLLRESYLKPAVISAILFGGVAISHGTRSLSWLGMVAVGAGLGFAYCILILVTRFFDEYDWSKIEGCFPWMRKLRRAVALA